MTPERRGGELALPRHGDEGPEQVVPVGDDREDREGRGEAGQALGTTMRQTIGPFAEPVHARRLDELVRHARKNWRNMKMAKTEMVEGAISAA